MADRFRLVYGQKLETSYSNFRNFTIECFRVFPSKEMNMDNLDVPHPHFRKEPGTYCRLTGGGKYVMDDSLFREHGYKPFLKAVRGNVLIVGIGLGMALESVLKEPEVTSVTVLEEERNLIKLMEPYFANTSVPLRMVKGSLFGDFMKLMPQQGRFFDTVLIDIFPDIQDTNERRAMIEVAKSRILPMIKPVRFNKTERAIFVWGEPYMKYFPKGKGPDYRM